MCLGAGAYCQNIRGFSGQLTHWRIRLVDRSATVACVGAGERRRVHDKEEYGTACCTLSFAVNVISHRDRKVSLGVSLFEVYSSFNDVPYISCTLLACNLLSACSAQIWSKRSYSPSPKRRRTLTYFGEFILLTESKKKQNVVLEDDGKIVVELAHGEGRWRSTRTSKKCAG